MGDVDQQEIKEALLRQEITWQEALADTRVGVQAREVY